jgi:hypothetical protein
VKKQLLGEEWGIKNVFFTQILDKTTSKKEIP